MAKLQRSLEATARANESAGAGIALRLKQGRMNARIPTEKTALIKALEANYPKP